MHLAPRPQCCSLCQESLAAVYAFVRDTLADPASEFYLFTTPPRQVMPNDAQKNLKVAGLVPSAVVYIGLSFALVGCSGTTKTKEDKENAALNFSIFPPSQFALPRLQGRKRCRESLVKARVDRRRSAIQ